MAYAECSTVKAVSDIWRVMESSAAHGLHDLHIVSDPGESYGLKDFARDHRQITDWTIDALAATGGGIVSLASKRLGPLGTIPLGTMVGASIETSLRALTGDDHYLKNAARGGLLGGGAATAAKLEATVADVYGARISTAVGNRFAAPSLGGSVTRMIVPGIESGGTSTFTSKVVGLGLDRARASMYYQSVVRPAKEAAEDTTSIFHDSKIH